MAKFFGKIGYAVRMEIRPGVWDEVLGLAWVFQVLSETIRNFFPEDKNILRKIPPGNFQRDVYKRQA